MEGEGWRSAVVVVVWWSRERGERERERGERRHTEEGGVGFLLWGLRVVGFESFGCLRGLWFRVCVWCVCGVCKGCVEGVWGVCMWCVWRGVWEA